MFALTLLYIYMHTTIIYIYRCVVLLLYMCPQTPALLTRGRTPPSYICALILLYICRRTAIYIYVYTYKYAGERDRRGTRRRCLAATSLDLKHATTLITRACHAVASTL